jgi:hypothetical protein
MKEKNIKTHPHCTEVSFRDPVNVPNHTGAYSCTYTYTGEPLVLDVIWGEGARIHTDSRVIWVPWDNIKYVSAPVVSGPVPESERHEGEKVAPATKVVLKKKGKE